MADINTHGSNFRSRSYGQFSAALFAIAGKLGIKKTVNQGKIDVRDRTNASVVFAT